MYYCQCVYCVCVLILDMEFWQVYTLAKVLQNTSFEGWGEKNDVFKVENEAVPAYKYVSTCISKIL